MKTVLELTAACVLALSAFCIGYAVNLEREASLLNFKSEFTISDLGNACSTIASLLECVAVCLSLVVVALVATIYTLKGYEKHFTRIEGEIAALRRVVSTMPMTTACSTLRSMAVDSSFETRSQEATSRPVSQLPSRGSEC
jgi:hypothetical protein